MTNEQIDNLFNAFENINIEQIASLINDEQLKIRLDNEGFAGEIKDLVFKNLMRQIELDSSAYDYFISYFDVDKEFVTILIPYISDKSKIKEVLDGELSNSLTKLQKIELIEQLDKEELIQVLMGKVGESLNNSEKIKLIKKLDPDSIIKILDGTIGDSLNDLDKSELRNVVAIKLKFKDIIKSKEVKQNFRLPKEMTVGIEIESEGDFSNDINQFFSFKNWKVISDRSLNDGVEVISPIMHPTDNDAKEIYMVTGMLEELGQNMSDRCGGHIHIGADYLKSFDAYINLMIIWGNTEKILYAICNEQGTIPRNNVSKYAPPITDKFQHALETGIINLSNEYELDEFVQILKGKVQNEEREGRNARYSGINFLNVNEGKNTVEFRLANGTINPELWMDNINLFGGIVAVAQELTETQDKTKLNLLYRFQEETDDKEKLNMLLELIGIDKTTNREIYNRYVSRYESNLKLIENSTQTISMFSKIKCPLKLKEVIDIIDANGTKALKNVEATSIPARDILIEAINYEENKGKKHTIEFNK